MNNNLNEELPQEILDLAEEDTWESLPANSLVIYESTYKSFIDWKTKMKVVSFEATFIFLSGYNIKIIFKNKKKFMLIKCLILFIYNNYFEFFFLVGGLRPPNLPFPPNLTPPKPTLYLKLPLPFTNFISIIFLYFRFHLFP